MKRVTKMKELASLFVFASPSGGGKTSLVKALIKTVDSIAVSVSHTTRMKREAEKEGKHYYFIDDRHFDSLVKDNAFIEHAHVFGAQYGTSRFQIETQLERGIDVVLDIDWQGARQLKEQFNNIVTVFILPPSVEVLKERLKGRNQDEDSVIEARMKKAQDEIKHYNEFDYLVVNDDFDTALRQITEIVNSHRLKLQFQSEKHQTLLSNLLMSK